MYIQNICTLLLYFSLHCEFPLIMSEPLRGTKVRDAKENEFLFVVAIGFKDQRYHADENFICTGALISKRHVLTAAHCFDGLSLDEIEITTGSVDLRSDKIKKYYPSFWITYRQWATQNCVTIEFSVNDIGIIKLSESVKNPKIKPAKLTKKTHAQIEGSEATLVGWGVTFENAAETSRTLKTAQVLVTPPETCKIKMRKLTNKAVPIPLRYLCSTANPCVLSGLGDSGGPMLSKSNKVIAIMKGCWPNVTGLDFPEDFLNENTINLHTGVVYYKNYIKDVLKKY